MKSNVLKAMLIVSLCSCSSAKTYNEPQFIEEHEITGKCLSDDLMISYAYDMAVDSRYVYILALSEGKWLHVYDKHDGRYLGSTVHAGQGPGEIHTALSLMVDGDNLQIYDQSQKKLFNYSVKNEDDSLQVSFVDDVNFSSCSGIVRRAWDLGGQYLVDGQLGVEKTGQKRFQLYDGNFVVSQYNDFPVENEDMKKAFLSPNVCFSPSKNKMATGTLYGGVLETFDLSSTSISLSGVYRFYEPLVSFKAGELVPATDMKYGFSAMCATDDVIYSVLIGDSDVNNLYNISIFDWNGKGLARYKTDRQIFKLSCYSGTPSELYALTYSRSEGFSLYLYRVEI